MTDSTRDPVADFKAAIEAAGLTPPKDVHADGHLHRFAPNGDARDDAGWYVLHLDGVPAGQFGSWRHNISRPWSAKRRRDLTFAERRQLREQLRRAKAERARADAKNKAEARERAAAIWARAGPAAADHPYLVAKGIAPPKGLRQDGDKLVVPVRRAGALHGLQFIMPDGDKKFLKYSAVGGCWAGFGRPTDTVVIAEGLATGASVSAALGAPFAVAFSHVNLEAVALALAERFPETRIVVAGDNNADKTGVGERAARAAAEAVGGVAIIPPAPGDWNDVAQAEGLEAVRRAFDGVFGDDPPVDDLPSADAAPPDVSPEGGPQGSASFFRPLGHDHTRYYFITTRGKQVISFSGSALNTHSAFLQLAPLHFWEREFPGENGFSGNAMRRAVNWLFDACYRAGVYTPDSIRGRGAWWDDGRVVLHCGDRLVVDNQTLDLTEITSSYVYEAAPAKRPPARAPLNKEEARRLYDISRSFRWENPLSGIFLAGFVALARAGGALQWRPHVWITGPRGCGKSSILRQFIQPLCGDWYLDVEFDASGAFIRQSLDSEAFAVTYDEGEAKSAAGLARLQNVLGLVRSASREGSGAIGRGGADGRPVKYRIRSCFAIASIYVNLQEAADFSRTSVLTLRETKGQNEDELERINQGFEWAAQPSIADGLFARTLKLLPQIRENQKSFTAAIKRLRLGDQRFGDQIGTLLAGAYSLVSDGRIRHDKAEEFIKQFSWDDHTAAMAESDEINCLRHLMQCAITVENDSNVRLTRSFGELVAAATGTVGAGLSKEAANRNLRRYGLRVDEAPADSDRAPPYRLAVAQKHLALKKLFHDTPFAVDYARLLRRLPFAWTDSKAKVRFFTEVNDPDGEPENAGAAENATEEFRTYKAAAVFMDAQQAIAEAE